MKLMMKSATKLTVEARTLFEQMEVIEEKLKSTQQLNFVDFRPLPGVIGTFQ